ncbi:MAG: hypothetical protein ACOCZ8_05810, partial [Bacteroidota bacterium]
MGLEFNQIIRDREVLFPKDGYLIHANDVWFKSEEDNSLIQKVTDAEGRTLYSRHRETHLTDTTGWGYVFMPDPLTTANRNYGGAYVDASDSDVPELNAERVMRPLRDLTYINGSFRLQGPYVQLENIDNPFVPQETSTDGNFLFTRAEQGFEQVNVYFHIDSMQRYMRSLDFFNLVNWPLRVDAHGFSNADNSAYFANPDNPQQAYLLFGEGGVDDAEDADVIIHEYIHAVSDAASPESNEGFARQGLDEGYADYFAVSYSRGLNAYDFRKVFSWDGHNPFWPGRTLDDTRQYNPTMFNNIYELGAYWGTALL